VGAATEIPAIKAGFGNIDDFIARAQTILQRRKSRSGRSLELQTKAIFTEERLIENTDFFHQPESEGGKKPDFLFPSASAYADSAYPADKLRMVAVKRLDLALLVNREDQRPVGRVASFRSPSTPFVA